MISLTKQMLSKHFARTQKAFEHQRRFQSTTPSLKPFSCKSYAPDASSSFDHLTWKDDAETVHSEFVTSIRNKDFNFDTEAEARELPRLERKNFLLDQELVENFKSTDMQNFASSRDRQSSCERMEAAETKGETEPDTLQVSDVLLNQLEIYGCKGTVSLHSVMQSTVPVPYCPGNERMVPTHLNMPGGGHKRKAKFTAGAVEDGLHPSSFH